MVAEKMAMSLYKNRGQTRMQIRGCEISIDKRQPIIFKYIVTQLVIPYFILNDF